MSVAVPQSGSRRRHRSHSVSRGASDSLERGLGLAAELLLAAVIVLAPLAWGAVEYWAQWWMMLGVGAALVCLLVRWIAYPRTLALGWTWAFVPVALFLAIALLQILPLPASVLNAASPKAAEAWSEVSQLLPGEPVRRTLSLYPLATERQLRLLILVSVIFALVFIHVRERVQIVRLLWAMVVSGSVVAAIAISQNASDGKSTWLGVQTSHPDSGPFMNHSAFGQFMNLATGATLGLLLMGLKRQIGDRVISFRSLKHHLFRKSSASLLIPLLFVLVAPVLVALSMTRGGVLSLVISGAVVGIVLGLTQSGRGKRTILAILGFLVFLVMLKFGFDRVYDRMATLRDVHETGGGVRLQMVRDMMGMVRDFPLFGVGLGAFAHVFPTYDTASIAAYATHAENEYAQLLVETGIVGASVVALFLVIVSYNAVYAILYGRRSIHAATIGLVFGLLCILIHSASDFGQHVPAIASVTAVVTALLVRLGADARTDRVENAAQVDATSPRPAVRYAAIAGMAVVLVCWVLMLGRTSTESEAESAWMVAKRNYLEIERRGLADASDGEFIQTLQGMSRAAELVSGDADYRYGLNAMRWQSIRRYDRELVTEFLQRISDESLKVSTVAPYFGPAITFAGQVRVFDLGDESGVALIRRGHALSRYSREASFAVAMLDAQEGKWDSCISSLKHAIALGASRSDAAKLLAGSYQRTDLALQLVEGSRPDMIALAQTLQRIGETEHAQNLIDRATELLIAEANKEDAPVDALIQLAEAYVREGQHANAIPLLRRALVVRYDRADWRAMLIRSLVEVGETDQALSEARTNIRLNPGDPEAKQLLEDLLGGGRKPRVRPN